MKVAIICPICYKPKKFSESYAIKLIDYTAEPEVNGSIVTIKDQTKKVRVCRTCTKKMGYKVKVAKPKDKK